MAFHSQLFVAAPLMLVLLAACGKREEQESAANQPAPAAQTAETAEAPGKTTTFEESTPEPSPQQ